MAKTFRKYRSSIIALAFVVGLAVVGGAAALRLTKYPDYWLSAAGLVVAVILPHRRPPAARDVRLLARSSQEGRGKSWRRRCAINGRGTIARISDPYPLMVPFSVVTTGQRSLIRPASSQKRGEGVPPEGGAAAQPAHHRTGRYPSWTRGRLSAKISAAEPLVLDGAFEDIDTVFANGGLPERMVILGEPGSGKSILAQWLTGQASGQPSRDEAHAGLPVAGHVGSGIPLEEWAAQKWP